MCEVTSVHSCLCLDNRLMQTHPTPRNSPALSPLFPGKGGEGGGDTHAIDR